MTVDVAHLRGGVGVMVVDVEGAKRIRLIAHEPAGTGSIELTISGAANARAMLERMIAVAFSEARR